MTNRIMALCDSETGYLNRLTEFLEDKKRLPFHVYCFSGTKPLIEFCREKEIELLLIAESMYRRDLKDLPVAQIIILSESGRKTDGELYHINKYQSSENIFREIMNGYAGAAELSEQLHIAGQMKIIGNYTPVRRCLQTTFSLCMGQLLARNYSVLYMNFESYSGFSYMLNREFAADMSDVLYFFRCEKERLAMRLKGMIQSVNGLDYIPPVLSYRDLDKVTGEQWVKLFAELQKALGYDYLILDLSEQIQGLFDILRECCLVYTITGQDGFAAAKMRQYEMLLRMEEYEDVWARTRKCGLPVFERLPAGLEQLTHGELAAYVEKIIKEDLYGNTGYLKKEVKGTDTGRN